MNDQVPNNEQKPYETGEPEDWRAARRRERMLRRQQRGSRRGEGWVAGLILILLGGIFLLQNAGLLVFQNWWALFILIPAIAAFANAWTRYQETGHVDAAVRGSAFVGLILVLVTAAFLFQFFNTALFWPALLIVAGIGILANAMWR